MLEEQLFGSMYSWQRRRRLRPLVLAVFSYRYDAELVPDLLANIENMVDGWIAFDDRKSPELYSNEPRRRRLLVERARELGASWVLALDPDERVERGAATRIRGLTSERQRIVWEFNLREMFSASSYRVDGIWGSKMQGRLFPTFDGPVCSEQPLHGAWCVAPAGYAVLQSGLNLYHLKMMSHGRRLARRDLYQHLDPDNLYQRAGYNYLVGDDGAVFAQIPPTRDFFPAHRESGQLCMADVAHGAGQSSASSVEQMALSHETSGAISKKAVRKVESQLGQLRVSIGDRVHLHEKLAVIVIGLCAPQSLFNAVRSIVQQDTASEIIVVNSGGGDVATLLGEYLQDVVLVEVAEPVRVGAARNIGIQHSRASFVAFLAGDCMAEPGWVAERIRAHMDGECAVACVVDNDKTGNPFAWASHLMTYGHRMLGATEGTATAYGASYDRTLFDRYGYFSEAMTIGEDSEFHDRFRRSDAIWLHNSIRTVHCNPGGPASFLKDQFVRGLRGRYLADFFRADFTAFYIALTTVRRVTRSLYLSLSRLSGKDRLMAIASWPLLPIGATCYASGMFTSYVRAITAEKLFQKACKMALLGSPEAAVGLVKRALGLRPVTARYQLALGTLLKETGEDDQSTRELYASWDIDRRSIVDVYCGGRTRAAAEIEPSVDPVRLQVAVFCDSSAVQLAEFLKAIAAQTVPLGKSDVLVVETRQCVASEAMHQVRQLYADVVTFVALTELASLLDGESNHLGVQARSFLIVSSSSCAPPPDWLAVLKAHIVTYPEVELFHGSCRPQHVGTAGVIERMSYDLGLFPRTPDLGGALCFAHAANWACDRSLLAGIGGMTRDNRPLGVWTLTERAMKAGASSIYASEWQSGFRIDSTPGQLLRRFYDDGYYGAGHVVVTEDRDIASRFFSFGGLRGSARAAWRFATDHFKGWRFANRFFLLAMPAFLLLLSAGLARQAGWLAGLRRFGGDDPVSLPRAAAR